MTAMQRIFTHHARKQWSCRFDDLGCEIEEEFAAARPASPKVRRKLCGASHRCVRRQRDRGDTPVFYVTRRCIFPCLHKDDGRLIVTTVFYRRKSV